MSSYDGHAVRNRRAMNLDIVIPVYNEGANITRVLDALRASVRTPFRILICYDRDDDNTLPVLAQYPAGLELHLVRNRGQGPTAPSPRALRKAAPPPSLFILP